MSSLKEILERIQLDNFTIKLPFLDINLKVGDKEVEDKNNKLDLMYEAFMEMNGSYVPEITDQLTEVGTSPDYMIIEFSDDKKWLTSRLYLTSILFEIQKNIRAVVFLETTKEVQKKFVGWAYPRHIRFALARYNPWLEEAYSMAYAMAVSEENITSNRGKLRNRQSLIELMFEFLKPLQSYNPPIEEIKQWTKLSSNNAFERAEWVNCALLEDYIDNDFKTRKMNSSRLHKMAKADQIKSIVEGQEEFIPLTRADGSFEGLITRSILLEHVIKNIMDELN